MNPPSDSTAPEFEPDFTSDSWIDRVREAETSRVLDNIGGYELLEEVGRGSQGIVYRARQEGLGRTIALKRLLAGRWSSEAARRRFAREIEAGSGLRHPSLVTVFGVEFVDDQPLLAMEWVEGELINRWARRQDRAAILEVFVRLCDGIRHAHGNGVIHRDLKPGNILVDAEACPRVLDFGLARVDDGERESFDRITQASLFVGTPAYASPEQVANAETAAEALTDVYSLGVILYEMLTGELPYPETDNLPELFRFIESHDPRPPSALRSGLPRELDVIVLKALAKDRARRYRSVDALMTDVQRHLAGEAVLAHPPSAWYQLRKIVTRHRLASSLVAALVVLILGSAIGATIYAGQLADERDTARTATNTARIAEAAARAASEHMEDERDRAATVLRFLVDDVVAAALPLPDEGELTVGEFLGHAETAVGDRFAHRPLEEAAIRISLGEIYRNLGRVNDADRQHRLALELRERQLPPGHRDVIDSQLFVAQMASILGHYEDAVTVARDATATLALEPGRDPDLEQFAAVVLGRALIALERFDEAEEALRSCVRETRSRDTIRSQYWPHLFSGLASVAARRGRHAEARRLYERAVSALEAQRHRDPISEAMIRQEIGTLLTRTGRLVAAAEELEGALGTIESYLGGKHLRTLAIKVDLAAVLRSQGLLTRALVLYEEVYRSLMEAVPSLHPFLIPAQNGLANTLALLGRKAEAERHYAEALAAARRVYGDDSETVASTLLGLSNAVADRGDEERAGKLLRESMEITARIAGEDSILWLHGLRSLGAHAMNAGRLNEAESALDRAWVGLEKALGAHHLHTLRARTDLALVLEKLGEPEDAQEHLEAVLTAQREDLADDHPFRSEVHIHLGRVAAAGGRLGVATENLEQGLEIDRRPIGHSDRCRHERLLARCLVAGGRVDEATTRLDRLLRELRRQPDPNTREIEAIEAVLEAIREE